MKTAPLLPALALCAFSVTASAGLRPVGIDEARLLRSMEDPALESLRAGIVAAPRPVGPGERTALRAAQVRSPDLAALRAGRLEISDKEFKVIAIVLAVILILVII